MHELMTAVTWMFGLWIATKLLPPLIDGIRHGIQQKQTRDLITQHPEHAYEITRAAGIQATEWKPPAAARKGGILGKLVVMGLCIGYIVFPIDFIPDVIPILGWGDDLVAGIIGLKAMLK